MMDAKRFDEWEEINEVDCNKCSNYWDNSCDGVQKCQIRSCTAFKATRYIYIPQEIKRLKTALKWLVGAIVGLGVVQVILIYYFTKL